MEKHLAPHSRNKEVVLKVIFGGVTPESSKNAEINVRCGTSRVKSYFAFLRGSGNTSQIVGYCESNRLDHLLEDFDFLINQMRLSKINFELRDIYIRTNDEKLVKKSFRKYIAGRSVLSDLIAMTGLIPFISAVFLLGWDFSAVIWNSICPIIVGFIIWVVVLFIGYRSEPEYVLKK